MVGAPDPSPTLREDERGVGDQPTERERRSALPLRPGLAAADPAPDGPLRCRRRRDRGYTCDSDGDGAQPGAAMTCPAQARWWAGQPISTRSGASDAVTLTFNRALDVARVVLADGTAQPVSAEIVTTGGNQKSPPTTRRRGDRRAAIPVGDWRRPDAALRERSAITYAAISQVWPVGRILRSDEETPWTLVGESVALVHYDAQSTAGVCALRV
ncbi:MAG: hypothetical protein R2856_14730 [Caldilineaceae bacterium]